MDCATFIVNRVRMPEGTGYRWVVNPDEAIVYVNHELADEDFQLAVGEGSRALIDDEFGDRYRERPALRLVV